MSGYGYKWHDPLLSSQRAVLHHRYDNVDWRGRRALRLHGVWSTYDLQCFWFSNQQSQLANRFTCTGREWDETLGLHHFRVRWMMTQSVPGVNCDHKDFSNEGSPGDNWIQ